MKLDEIVKKYIALRDRKSEIGKEYKAKIADIDKVLDKIEAALLSTFDQFGMNSAQTDDGTAYISERTSATVADWDVVLDFVVEKEAWEMLERRVSKSAVDQYLAEHQELPPGVNYRTERTLSVRRPS
jgi:hypothetical protein